MVRMITNKVSYKTLIKGDREISRTVGMTTNKVTYETLSELTLERLEGG